MTDNITLPRAVVEQALDAFNVATTPLARDRQEVLKAMEALRAALEQQQGEQEPVTWMTEDGRIATDATKQWGMASTSKPNFNIPLYTHPKPHRQPLTDEQITELADAHMEAFAQFVGAGEVWFEGEHDFARAIERAHGIVS